MDSALAGDLRRADSCQKIVRSENLTTQRPHWSSHCLIARRGASGTQISRFPSNAATVTIGVGRTPAAGGFGTWTRGGTGMRIRMLAFGVAPMVIWAIAGISPVRATDATAKANAASRGQS